MAKHSISDAARLAGKSRSTIHRHIDNGKLSSGKDEEGNPFIETAELTRVYGSLQGATVSDTGEIVQRATPKSDRKTAENLEAQHASEMIAELRERNRQLMAERDDWKEQADKWQQTASQLLLAPPAPEMPIAAAQKREDRPGVLKRVKEFWWG